MSLNFIFISHLSSLSLFVTRLHFFHGSFHLISIPSKWKETGKTGNLFLSFQIISLKKWTGMWFKCTYIITTLDESNNIICELWWWWCWSNMMWWVFMHNVCICVYVLGKIGLWWWCRLRLKSFTMIMLRGNNRLQFFSEENSCIFLYRARAQYSQEKNAQQLCFTLHIWQLQMKSESHLILNCNKHFHCLEYLREN